jgi:hypothetical protein
MVDFTIKENDTSPIFQRTLVDPSGTAVNLVGSSVVFKMYDQLRTTQVISSAATLTDAVNGVVTYDWQAVDTVAKGWYWVELEVTYADTAIETFPNDGYISLRITGEL